MTARAYIQYQDRSGMWRTINECDTDQVTIFHRLNDAERSYKSRVRAVDTRSGSIIDLRG
jgi:hypothetical protein